MLTHHVVDVERPKGVVVLLHGYASSASDLSPFASALGLDLRFVFPEAPLEVSRGRGWWSIDEEASAPDRLQGPRDLSTLEPEAIAELRARVGELLDHVALPGLPLVIGGFSQGAMLACDFALHDPRALAGLVLLSGARIRATAWAPRFAARRGLPVFASHGRADDDLSFDAAAALASDLEAGGMAVTFFPFDGGHEVPLVAWRALKKFLRAVSGA